MAGVRLWMAFVILVIPSTSSSLSVGPKETSSRARRRRPSPTREGRSREELFDGEQLTAQQQSNHENPKPLDLGNCALRCMNDLDPTFGDVVYSPHMEFYSLDDVVHPGLSDVFNSDANFRRAVREALRLDVFETTPAYQDLSSKASSTLLLPDSSLQGSWKCSKNDNRMKRLTQVLREALGKDAPTGDELMERIGALCGSSPSTHWIDIVGVQNRKITHSWHLDTGLLPHETTRTVLWGFPPGDQYDGCGVFSHVVPLVRSCHAPLGHPRMEPVLFQGDVEELSIVRPRYKPGNELLVYRDVDVLHSSPDVAHRMSVMRFM